MSDNLFELFRARFLKNRARAFIETEAGRVHTYADLDAASGRYARLLMDLGVVKGDRVAVQVDKSPEAVFLYLACLRAGAIYLPLNTAYTRAEIAYFLGDGEPAVVVCRPENVTEIEAAAHKAGVRHVLTLGTDGDGSLMERAHALAPFDGCVATASGDVAAILYTSGTTGRSKGAMLTHGNLA
ncbi:MAG: AMP-binding protein, partial [Kiloniellaceae bacterium]